MERIRKSVLSAMAGLVLVALMPQAAFAAQGADIDEEPITESSEYRDALENFTLDVDVNSGESKSASTTLSDGTVLSLAVEPVAAPSNDSRVAAAAQALSGWYKVSGNNGLAYMEYYIRLAPVSAGSLYTKIAEVDQNSLIINAWAGTSFSGETIVIRRANETATQSAWVQGRAVFTYAGGALTLTGGVEARAWDGVLRAILW